MTLSVVFTLLVEGAISASDLPPMDLHNDTHEMLTAPAPVPAPAPAPWSPASWDAPAPAPWAPAPWAPAPWAPAPWAPAPGPAPWAPAPWAPAPGPAPWAPAPGPAPWAPAPWAPAPGPAPWAPAPWAPAPASPGVGGGKAGIAAHLQSGPDTDAIAGSQISWNYNWAMTGAWQDGLDYYPQIHDAGSMGSLGDMPDASVWLAFNEPNMDQGVGGANMDVGQVVEFWGQIEQAANDHGVSILVGPNVANVNPDQWYDDFFNQCPNCRVDAIGFHSYSCDLDNMQSLVGKLQKYGKPLWLTEFACADNPNSIPGNDAGSKDWNWQCEYMQQVIPYLEGEASIAKYAWYSFNSDYTGNSELVSGGQLTDLGNCYNGLVSSLAGESGFARKADVIVV